MKLFKIPELLKQENPTPGEFYRTEILTAEDHFKSLGGLIAILVPGAEVPYHFHKDRESVIIALSGKGVEIVDGKEILMQEGDIICIQVGEKHGTANRFDEDFRYIEFYTSPPMAADFIEVE